MDTAQASSKQWLYIIYLMEHSVTNTTTKTAASLFNLQNQLLQKLISTKSTQPIIFAKENSFDKFTKLFDQLRMSTDNHVMEEESQQQNYEFDKMQPLDEATHSQMTRKLDDLNSLTVTKAQIEELFFRQKKDQEDRITKRRQQIDRKYPIRYDVSKDWSLYYGKQTINSLDLDTLNKSRDLNDNVINMHLLIIKDAILKQEVSEKSYFFNTYFMNKLIGNDLQDEKYVERIAKIIPNQFQKKLQDNYVNIRRWTRNVDIFDMDYLVVPINVPHHWNSIIVLYPQALIKPQLNKKPAILYLDSFGEKNKSLTHALRIYLRKQLVDKKKVQNPEEIQISEQTLPEYQLLLPRQTNYHDCGLYTMCFIESLFLNMKELEVDLSDVNNRYKLKLFPRSLIFNMRTRLIELFVKLAGKDREDQDRIIREEYLVRREQVIKEAKENMDYDEISDKQFQKYLTIHNKKVQKNTEEQFANKIAFYTKADFNFFESSYHQR